MFYCTILTDNPFKDKKNMINLRRGLGEKFL